jgi:hypothetical protein
MRTSLRLGLMMLAALLGGSDLASAQTAKIKLGYAKCAHCLPMSLIPGMAKNVEV